MPSFEVELTISATGSARIEADSIEAARNLAEKIQAHTADFTLTGPISGFDFTPEMYDVEIDGVYELDEEAAQRGLL